MNFRAALQTDEPVLTGLRRRSKEHWGYPTEWVEVAEGEIRLPKSSSDSGYLMDVTEREGKIVAFYSLIRHNAVEAELDDFFVEASLIGEGLGKLLWLNATRRATDLGHKKLRIVADPNAASFYVKQGALRIGETMSRMDEKRILPILIYDLAKVSGD